LASFAKHIKEHIKNGEVSDGSIVVKNGEVSDGSIVGECTEWSGKDEARTSALAEG